MREGSMGLQLSILASGRQEGWEQEQHQEQKQQRLARARAGAPEGWTGPPYFTMEGEAGWEQQQQQQAGHPYCRSLHSALC